ncbi:MAG: methyltransferase domain-containing protein [Pedobacter sp.]|nr:methyltransferase domain-containing protein [Pedobacter sp.]MDQ8052669.1 methyltransferase domain-containing protein [Pedobacter sp.]
MDIFGKALQDYYLKGKTGTLWLHNSYDVPEEMPIDVFFRNEVEMPDLEITALEHCKGTILDIGAGVGSHALYLQKKGMDVTAIDISGGAVSIMKKRGVKKAFEQDIFTFEKRFDTLLLLMNGIGLTGTLAGFSNFLIRAKTLINPGGQLIFDSSNISYLYTDLQKPTNRYFGEVSYRYAYQNQLGNWFDWLYIDQETLATLSKSHGWECEIMMDDGEDQYLARLTIMS